MAVLSGQSWCKIMKLDIAFLRYANFIEDVIKDWWKNDFVKKALKIWESVRSIGILAIERSFLHKHTVFAPNISNILKILYEKSQNSTLGLYFEIFYLCIPIPQNPVFWQLVHFDMLSHIVSKIKFSWTKMYLSAPQWYLPIWYHIEETCCV